MLEVWWEGRQDRVAGDEASRALSSVVLVVTLAEEY
jgi:hypothetical protein